METESEWDDYESLAGTLKLSAVLVFFEGFQISERIRRWDLLNCYSFGVSDFNIF
jgi:hypothetical protein